MTQCLLLQGPLSSELSITNCSSPCLGKELVSSFQLPLVAVRTELSKQRKPHRRSLPSCPQRPADMMQGLLSGAWASSSDPSQPSELHIPPKPRELVGSLGVLSCAWGSGWNLSLSWTRNTHRPPSQKPGPWDLVTPSWLCGRGKEQPQERRNLSRLVLEGLRHLLFLTSSLFSLSC